MAGMKKTLLKYWKSAVFSFIAFLLFYSGMKSYVNMETSSSAVVELYGEYPSRQQAEEILKDCQSADEVTDVCFVANGGMENVENPDLSRQITAQVTKVCGMAALYDRAGAALEERDESGCIIDSSLASALFGSRNCVGGKLLLGEKLYQVRGIASWNQPVILIRSWEKEQLYTQVLIGRKKGQNPQNAANSFLMGNGLSGTLVDDSWLLVISSWFPAVFLLAFAIWAGKWIGKMQGEGKISETGTLSKAEKSARFRNAFLKVLIWAVCLFLISRLVTVPSDWLPDKWSDFSFWPEKIKKETQLLKWYLMLPKTMAQTECLINAGGCMGKCGAASLMLLFSCF